jgi:hypothetical protein
MQQLASATRTVSLILLSVCCTCSGEKSDTGNVANVANAASADNATKGVNSESSPNASDECDASLWNHVYNPTRLQHVARCLSVTGVIEESDANPDGDQHFLLRLDPGQDTLVNKRNRKKKGGAMVLEIVCANPTSMKKPKAACAGYTNPIAIPPVGAHVRATGTYVLDSHNGWMEIHPGSKLERR